MNAFQTSKNKFYYTSEASHLNQTHGFANTLDFVYTKSTFCYQKKKENCTEIVEWLGIRHE